jgi:hypothetical protein
MFLSIEKGFIKNYQQDRINSLIKANSYYAMKKNLLLLLLLLLSYCIKFETENCNLNQNLS